MKFIVHQSSSRGEFTYVKQDRIGYLNIDNPNARNAISINMMVSLPLIIQSIENNLPNVLVIRGADKRFFCSGGAGLWLWLWL